ncbi:MAG: purine-nucleoside phosphorylase [Planctomycetota bacterium]|jgi:purine-nucleoside phosphorylase
MARFNGKSLRQSAKEAADHILNVTGERPRVAMLLGTGHSSIAGQLVNKHSLRPDDLPEGLRFSKDAPLLFGYFEGVPVVVSDAPLPSYEGHSAEEVTYPIPVLRALGADVLILTAAAASLSLQLEAGTIAVIEDHINLSGMHPLQRPDNDLEGPRFPDMSDPYTASWRELARQTAREIGIPCLQGVFAAVAGPSLPTRAEYRFLKRAGADLVGMSLVPEVLAAVHAGFEVLALVAVTQVVRLESHVPTSIEEMLDAADVAAPRVASMLSGIMAAVRQRG